MEFTHNEMAEATMSISQVMKGIDEQALSLLIGIRNTDISKCIVSTSHGLVQVYIDDQNICIDTGNFTICCICMVSKIADLFDPFLDKVREKFKKEAEATKAFNAEFEAMRAGFAEN